MRHILHQVLWGLFLNITKYNLHYKGNVRA